MPNVSDPPVLRVHPLTKLVVVVVAGSALLNGFPNAAPVTPITAPLPGDRLMGQIAGVFKEGPVGQAVTYVGLWQYWAMFAPNPSRQDQWLEATLTRADGTEDRVLFPRMVDTPVLERYHKERYRKWLESGGTVQNAFLWPALAQWMAQRGDDPNNPPVGVTLHLRYRTTPEPGQPATADYLTDTFYRYVVDQQRLAAWRQETASHRVERPE